MKLEKLAQIIDRARSGFKLDGTDIRLIDNVARAIKERKQVTIMEIVGKGDIASPATIHAKIKRLCDDKFLNKVEHPTNMRYKVLELGPTYYQFVEELKRV